MFSLPTAMPRDAYEHVSRKTGVPMEFIRALAIKESMNQSEDPASIRLETHHWKTRRLNHKAARAFDNAKNSKSTATRWDQFFAMDDLCKADANIVPKVRWAALQCHSFTVWQVMGFNYQECGFEDPQNFFDCLKTVEGHCRIMIGFLKGSQRCVELACRMDMTPRTISTRRGPKKLKLGDLSEFSMHFNGINYELNNHDTDILKILKSIGGGYA